jgi:cytidine deaminase
MCRQVIAEFAKSTTIYTASTEGSLEITPFEQLFPHAFTVSHMAK